MMELIEGLPDNVVAVAATGEVTRADYQTVLMPRLEQALAHHERIRCYYEIKPGFAGFDAGAAWEDLKIGVAHLTRWERIALVTDVDWIRKAVGALRFLVPGECRVFQVANTVEGRAWIAA